MIGGFVIESRSGARKAWIKFAKVNVWRPFDALPRTSIIRRAGGATLFDDGLSGSGTVFNRRTRFGREEDGISLAKLIEDFQSVGSILDILHRPVVQNENWLLPTNVGPLLRY